jgi:hypothetical protein
MFQHTALAGAGNHYVRLTALRTPIWSPSPMSIVTFYGADLDFGPGILTISNGATQITLDLGQSGPAQSPQRTQDAVQFSAPAVRPARLYAFNQGQRIDLLILPLETYEALNHGVATQEVMHTPRKYHGPGPYPETTRWGAWINSYRREAEERAAARAGGI